MFFIKHSLANDEKSYQTVGFFIFLVLLSKYYKNVGLL